ncbi:flavodoxin domain-containing protein [Kushneria konosiri]|uniref:Nitric oxide synthase n=1 Tax=Kushneria konosiri TaxID=698828 RepID=A0A2Z2H969_9GAMM|nr:flavodoxin domain-containing protein [Kushneria konosiri]ARS54033.1 nitric oxide synthase [Kushneria konosiri]
MPDVGIYVATVYGGALDVAEQIAPLFEAAGYGVEIHETPTLEKLVDPQPNLALFCISTTGRGDYPGNFTALSNALEQQRPSLEGLRYALIAMGDSSYEDSFCGAGRRLDELLTTLGGSRVGERLEVDASETPMADDAALPWAEQWLAAHS